MPAVLILAAVILIVVAYRNVFGSLATALETDVPAFGTWALALGGVGALGFIPGLRVPARWLLLLVLTVLVLKNYSAILAGFSGMTSGSATASAATPSSAYASNPQAAIPAADVTGTGNTTGTATTTANATTSGTTNAAAVTSGNVNANATGGTVSTTYDPNSYVQAFLTNAGFGGA